MTRASPIAPPASARVCDGRSHTRRTNTNTATGTAAPTDVANPGQTTRGPKTSIHTSSTFGCRPNSRSASVSGPDATHVQTSQLSTHVKVEEDASDSGSGTGTGTGAGPEDVCIVAVVKAEEARTPPVAPSLAAAENRTGLGSVRASRRTSSMRRSRQGSIASLGVRTRAGGLPISVRTPTPTPHTTTRTRMGSGVGLSAIRRARSIQPYERRVSLQVNRSFPVEPHQVGAGTVVMHPHRAVAQNTDVIMLDPPIPTTSNREQVYTNRIATPATTTSTATPVGSNASANALQTTTLNNQESDEVVCTGTLSATAIQTARLQTWRQRREILRARRQSGPLVDHLSTSRGPIFRYVPLLTSHLACFDLYSNLHFDSAMLLRTELTFILRGDCYASTKQTTIESRVRLTADKANQLLTTFQKSVAKLCPPVPRTSNPLPQLQHPDNSNPP